MISNFSKPIEVAIICEGPTENLFVKNVLYEHFKAYNAYTKPINMGGSVSTQKIIKHIQNSKKSNIRTTLVDYYGFQNPEHKTRDDLIKEIKDYFKEDNSVIPYIQMHEIEALWFSDIEKIIQSKNADEEQSKKLKKIIDEYSNPEDINNSKKTAPSKRLENIFQGYSKTRDGISIGQAIPMDTYMTKCPLFKEWIENIQKTIRILRNNNE